MGGLKRFIRHGLTVSALGHVGVLAVGLLLVWAAPQATVPPVPPDAMLVELVTPKEIPRFSGTPSDLRTSGTEAGKSQPMTAPSEPPQPKTVPQPPQPKEQRSTQRNAPPQTQEPRTASAQPQQPPMTQAEAAPAAIPPPSDPPAPSAEDTPDAPETAAKLAQLALLGGRLGGGFAAPPIDAPIVGYDFTLQFRERVSSCAPLAPGIDPTEKISITMQISLNRDGTLAAAPRPLTPNLSAKQQALMQSFINGLQKCQPYTMLPQDKYKQWKTLDLEIYPLDSLSR